MKVLESAAFALIVAAIAGLLAWRTAGDVVLVPAVSFLAAFIAAYMKSRTTTTRRTARRR